MIKVLIVDDDFMVTRVHQTYVDEIPGFEVVGSAHTGRDAVALAAELQPDLILLDIYLPDANGLELLPELRAASPDVDVLVISAAREADSVRRALRSGITQYLIKPFNFEDLRDRLLQYRQTLRTLESIDSTTNQEEVDRVFGLPGSPTSLPKGLSIETLRLVRGTLNDSSDDLSATEVGETLTISRGSARRYLEYLVTINEVEVRLQYGGVGRPERRYAISRDRH